MSAGKRTQMYKQVGSSAFEASRLTIE